MSKPEAPTPAGPANRGTLVVVSGPSGVGKSTIVQHLKQRLNAQLSVSATTRPPGPTERDGRDYFFLDPEQFQQKVRDGEFLEHAEYLGYCYGTPAGPVQQALSEGNIVLLEIEIQGGLQVAAMMPHAVMVYILPPARSKALDERLQGRGRDREETIRQRLAHADEEIRLARQSGKYRHFVVNDVLDDAVQQIAQVIQNHRRETARCGPLATG